MDLTSSNDIDFNDNFDCDKLLESLEDGKDDIRNSQEKLKEMFENLNE